ncbi:MAG TPA: ribosomal protein S18-alanine N-acetyltransferase [Rhizomicrobium sp.]|jgi:ribosomal-protein-alanine N-acetyltransferase
MIIVQTDDCEALAALHARCFDQPWDPRAIDELLSSGVSALVANENEVRCGFILYRVAADEAEIVSLGVTPEHRGRGTGKALVTAAAGEAAKPGALAMFLEVSERNAPALAVYKCLGFGEAGRRRDYYGVDDDALILRASLPVAAGT